MFARTPVVTLRSGIAALSLKLWDEERGCLVGYPPRRASERGAITLPPRAAPRSG